MIRKITNIDKLNMLLFFCKCCKIDNHFYLNTYGELQKNIKK